MRKENIKELLKDACALEENKITDDTIIHVGDLFDCLSDKEERVIRLRYGLDDGKPRTLLELAKEFGVTREKIRQIESKAIKKLRFNNF